MVLYSLYKKNAINGQNNIIATATQIRENLNKNANEKGRRKIAYKKLNTKIASKLADFFAEIR